MKILRSVWLLPLLLLVLLVSAFVSPLFYKPNPVPFVNHWGKVFSQHQTPESFHTIKASDRPDVIYLRRFGSNEWVAARSEHACTDGAGFNATVFLDSSGVIKYQSGHHFCGYEGLCCELGAVAASNLSGFYGGLTNVEFHVWHENAVIVRQKHTTF